MRRIDDPCQHLLAVRRDLPTRYYFTSFDLIIDIAVLIRQLMAKTISIDLENFIGLLHRMTEHKDIRVAYIA